MDSKLILELVRTIGLPGVVVVGWVFSLIQGNISPSSTMLWAAVLCAAGLVSAFSTQRGTLTALTELRDDLSVNTELTTNNLEGLAGVQRDIAVVLADVRDTLQGKLTTDHIVLFLPFIVDSVCLVVISSLCKLEFVPKEVANLTLRTQAIGQVSVLTQNHSFFNQPAVKDILTACVFNLVEYTYSVEIQAAEWSKRAVLIVEKAQTLFTDCTKALQELAVSKAEWEGDA